MSNMAMRKAVLAKIDAAGKLDKDNLRKVYAALAAKLQEGYAGRLQAMVPTDYDGTPRMSFARWADVFTFTVLEVIERHSFKEAQVMAALDDVLSKE